MRFGFCTGGRCEDRWEDFLVTQNQSTVYSSIKFKKFLQDVIPGIKPLYCYVEHGGNIIATLPIMISADGAVANSLPWYGSNPGIIENFHGSEFASEYLIDEAIRELMRRGVKTWTFINAPGLADPPFVDTGMIRGLARRTGMITYLPEWIDHDMTAERLMNRIHSKTRNQIRKAIKSGVEVEWVERPTEDDLLFVYGLHMHNMEAIGAPYKGFNVFKAIAKNFDIKTEWDLFIARKGEKRIAGLIVLYYHSTVEYFIPAVDIDYREINPLNLLIYRAMLKASEADFNLWNWGGTIPETMPGVYHFKKRWGSSEFPYTYFCLSFDDDFWNTLGEISAETIRKRYPFFFVRPFHARAAAEVAQ